MGAVIDTGPSGPAQRVQSIASKAGSGLVEFARLNPSGAIGGLVMLIFVGLALFAPLGNTAAIEYPAELVAAQLVGAEQQ